MKKLVYINLLAHAEREPDTALLAINSVQKSLSAADPHLRALALRVMSGIRVPVIAQIVQLAIKRGAGDMSPLVRKAAALAIPKCWRLDPSQRPQLLDFLAQLLGDKQYFVAGAAVCAMQECCPDRMDLLHAHYRGLVRKLLDMDEWAQVATMRLLSVYARKCFPRRIRRVKRGAENKHDLDQFYANDETTHTSTNLSETKHRTTHDGTEEVAVQDPDLTLLLKAAQSLLSSRSSAVIVAVARLFLYLDEPAAQSTYLQYSISALVALLRSPPAIQQTAMHAIVQVILAQPSHFVKYTTHFLTRSTDTPQIMHLKLEALSLVFPHASQHTQSLVLTELTHVAHLHDTGLVRAAVRALGRCAQSSPPGSPAAIRCLRMLLSQTTAAAPQPHGVQGDTTTDLVSESVTVVRHLIQSNAGAHSDTVTRLAKRLDTTQNPVARASIVWLVGEFAGTNDGDNIAADVLRILTKGFADESEPVKTQIVLLAAKVYVHFLNRQRTDDSGAVDASSEHDNSDSLKDTPFQESPSHATHPIPQLYAYVHQLVRYDTSYNLRDLARVYRAILPPANISDSTAAAGVNSQLATLLLLAPKPAPEMPEPSQGRALFALGSASSVLGSERVGSVGFSGYEPLPNWVVAGQEPDPRLREEVDEAGSVTDTRAVPASRLLDAQIAQVTRKAEPKSSAAAKSSKTLDDWLDEDEAESEDESESAEEEDDDNDSEEEEETTEEETDSDAEDSDDDANSGDPAKKRLI